MSSQLNQIQPPQLLSQTTNTTDPTITLNNLNKLLIGVTIAQSRGIKFLVAMMAHSKNELIQVEAAHALGCIALGKQQ